MKLTKTALCACVLLAAGCYPERIVWSPDGQQALLIGKDRLYLADPNGKLTDLGVAPPQCMAWMSDAKRYVAATTEKAGAWKDLEPLLIAEDKEGILRLAKDMRAEILAGGPPDKLKCVKDQPNEDILAAKIYLRDCDSEGLAKKLGSFWQEYQSASRDIFAIRICEISNAATQPAQVIAKSAYPVMSIRAAAHGKAVAWSVDKKGGKNSRTELFVAPADGAGKPVTVSPLCDGYFDWSPDGRSLVYIAPEGSAKDTLLGRVQRSEVCAADGTLLKAVPAPVTLAGVFKGTSRVRCLQDGRVIFASLEVELPTTENDLPDKANLFAFDPRQATLTRLLTRQAQSAVPDLVDFFSVSPDGTRVCIPGEKGEVAVVELATGKVDVIVAKPAEGGAKGGKEQKLRTVPVWRATGELCLMVPPAHPLGSPNRTEIILWQAADKARCLSKDWPDEVAKAVTGE
jgi:hypothetical protein